MVKTFDKNAQRMKRHTRVRGKISGTPERPRLNVYRSNANIYAQIIDDVSGVTLAAAASNEKDFEGATGNKEAAARSASWLQNAPRQRASTLSCSIVAVISTMVVWQSLPKAPVKAAWNFESGGGQNNGLQQSSKRRSCAGVY